MKPETKVKALEVFTEYVSKISISIHKGQFDVAVSLIDEMKAQLNLVVILGAMFPEGGMQDSATQITIVDGEVADEGESIVMPYRKGEVEEDFNKRVEQAKLSDRFNLIERVFRAKEEEE